MSLQPVGWILQVPMANSFCSTLAREEKQKTQSPMSDLRAVFYLMTRTFLNQIFYLLKGCRGSTIETIDDLDKGILFKPPKPSACPIKCCFLRNFQLNYQ